MSEFDPLKETASDNSQPDRKTFDYVTSDDFGWPQLTPIPDSFIDIGLRFDELSSINFMNIFGRPQDDE